MKIWINEEQTGFVRKAHCSNNYYFLLNPIYENAFIGNVKYRTMTYKEFKKLYPTQVKNLWWCRTF